MKALSSIYEKVLNWLLPWYAQSTSSKEGWFPLLYLVWLWIGEIYHVFNMKIALIWIPTPLQWLLNLDAYSSTKLKDSVSQLSCALFQHLAESVESLSLSIQFRGMISNVHKDSDSRESNIILQHYINIFMDGVEGSTMLKKSIVSQMFELWKPNSLRGEESEHNEFG